MEQKAIPAHAKACKLRQQTEKGAPTREGQHTTSCFTACQKISNTPQATAAYGNQISHTRQKQDFEL